MQTIRALIGIAALAAGAAAMPSDELFDRIIPGPKTFHEQADSPGGMGAIGFSKRPADFIRAGARLRLNIARGALVEYLAPEWRMRLAVFRECSFVFSTNGPRLVRFFAIISTGDFWKIHAAMQGRFGKPEPENGTQWFYWKSDISYIELNRATTRARITVTDLRYFGKYNAERQAARRKRTEETGNYE